MKGCRSVSSEKPRLVSQLETEVRHAQRRRVRGPTVDDEADRQRGTLGLEVRADHRCEREVVHLVKVGARHGEGGGASRQRRRGL